MDPQKEYNQFLAKLQKSAQEIHNDFKRLSMENQQRFAEEANAALRGYGYTIAVDDLMQKYFERDN